MAARKSPGKRATWQELAGQWKRSGQNVAAFCRQRGLNPSGLYVWRRRFGADLVGEAKLGGVAGFVPVTIVPSAVAPVPALEIELSNGRLLRLCGEVTPARLAAIANALEAAC
jgi:transposase-like protein